MVSGLPDEYQSITSSARERPAGQLADGHVEDGLGADRHVALREVVEVVGALLLEERDHPLEADRGRTQRGLESRTHDGKPRRDRNRLTLGGSERDCLNGSNPSSHTIREASTMQRLMHRPRMGRRPRARPFALRHRLRGQRLVVDSVLRHGTPNTDHKAKSPGRSPVIPC